MDVNADHDADDWTVDTLNNIGENSGIGFTEQRDFYFLQFFEFWCLFHDLMNRYQACLYLFECIFHGNSKYSNDIE